jgi:signal transduction histidine kinase
MRSALEGAAHICSLYNTPRDYLAVLEAFVEVGLARSEKCLCLVSREAMDSFQRRIGASGTRLAHAVEARTVAIVALEDAYAAHPEHLAQHALDFWSAAAAAARAAGFSGLRGIVYADRPCSATAAAGHWIDYESRLTRVLSQSGSALLCLYNRRAHPAEFIREVLRSHAVVAHRRKVGQNIFYVPPSEFDAADRAGREVERMLTSLCTTWQGEPEEQQWLRRVDLEYRVVCPDGAVKCVHTRGHPVFGPAGELTEYVGTVEDITELRHGEESLSSMQAELARATRAISLGQIMASIAHEVNQPLTALIANAGAGLRWLAGGKPRLGHARRALTRIARDGNRASEVIARIRALVRRADAERNSLDLNDVIGAVIALLKTELRRHKITVKTRLANPLPAVSGDRVQLQQVLLNLIMNAIESMSAVATRPRLLTIATKSDASGVSVTVKDRGVGLDEGLLERVFEPFYTTKPQGMGIGLAISRSIVETHGGLLWATRNRGAGATFECRLPTTRVATVETVQTNRLRR